MFKDLVIVFLSTFNCVVGCQAMQPVETTGFAVRTSSEKPAMNMMPSI